VRNPAASAGFPSVVGKSALGLFHAAAFSIAHLPTNSAIEPSFGSQAVSTTSAAKTVTLKNGQSVILTISSISVSGDYSQTNTCGTSLAAGANCSISVVFTPTILGSDDSSLTITDSASNSPQTVSLTGKGVAQAAAAPATLSFGNQADGTSSAAKTVTLTNNLGTALAISSIAVSGDYSQTNTCGTSLAAGANCSISVVFTPTILGSDDSSLTITDSASNSPQTVSLTGNGVIPVKVTPTSLGFGDEAVTATSSAKTVTVSNKQPTAVTITSITTPAAYAQTNTCGTLLAAEGACTVSVTFSPTTTGSQPGTLTVTDNASNSPQTVTLSGAGTALPTITGLSTTSGIVGTTVTVTGTGFDGSQGSSTVTFDGVTATPTSWAAKSIVVTVPTAATTGSVVVTVNGGSSNGVSFTVTPNITNLSTSSGIAGTVVTISGSGFGTSQGTSSVAFSGAAGSPTTWSSTSIVVPVPSAATAGNGSVVVTVDSVASNASSFAVVPNILGLSSTSGAVGMPITITGTGFGSAEASSTVTFNGVNATASSWSAGAITVTVPTGATSGNVVVLVAGIPSSGVNFTVQSSAFVATSGQMVAAEYGQTATQLTNGQVLLAGGMSTSGVLNSAQLYALSSQTFTAASPMNVARWLHTATLLNDGTVLIAGGSSLSNETTLNTAEIYDPVAGTFTLLSNTLNTARVGHTATLLSNGQVLIVGGYDPDTGIISDSELYDPTAQVFIDLGNTNTPRFHHTATLLQNGQVLITGGETDPTPSGAYNTAEIFNPATWALTPVSATMVSAREGHAATLLNDGTVLITGGDLPPNGSLNTAEIYNPSARTFTAASSSMTSPRIFHYSVLLNGGQVLLSGGENDSDGNSVALNTAELYDPNGQTFTATAGTMTSVREHQTATLLNDGTVLEAGGTDGTNIFNTAEIYITSQLIGLASIAIAPASPSVPLGSQQLLIATGTFGSGATQVLSSVLWSSSSTSVSTVSGDGSDSGYLTTVAQGTATITATADGVSGSTTVTVPAPTLVSITVNPQSFLLAVGTTQQFTATGTYSDGSVQDLTSSATWTSSAPAATVSIGGLVTGVSQGNSTIQASSGSQNGSTTISVGPPALVSIALSPANASIPLGASQQYQTIGTYSDGSTQNVTSSVEWSFVPSNIVSESSSGLITSLAQGTATLQAALGTVSGSTAVTVTSPVLLSSPASVNIDVGGTQQLSATGTYSNSSGTDVTSSSSWVSSNPTIAGVSPTGFVTAIANGNVTITATSGTASGIATVTVGTSTGSSLNTSRYDQSATLLNDGTLLIAAGINCPSNTSCSYLATAESYNPDNGTFAYTGSLTEARSAPAVLLPNGNVLIAGGYFCDSNGNCESLSSAEMYHPYFGYGYGYFSTVGNMTAPRTGHSMTLLNNGQVLIAGGQNCTSATSCTTLNTAEIYNPVTGTFTPTGNLNAARFNATATLLNQGLVLIAGGFDGTNYPAAAELYDPSTGTFASTGNLNTPRASASATLLNTGQVLVAGGSTCSSPGCPSNSAELYNATAGTFSSTGTLNVSRFNHSATLLTNGQVLIAGGYDSCSTSCTSDGTAELYDPVAGTFTSTQALTTPRSGQTGTLLPSGDVVLVGGIGASATLASIDSYTPSTLTPPNLTSITVTPANPSIPGNMAQQFAAIGTFSDNSTQTLQSAIWSVSNQTVTAITNNSAQSGFVYPQATGATTITATAESVNGNTVLNATAYLVSLNVTPQYPVLLLNQTQQLDAVGNYSDGSTQDLTTSVTWTSSNTQVATVSPGTPGLASAVGTGTANLTASFGSVNAYTSVTVQGSTPTIASLSTTSGSVGSAVGILGSDFGSAQESGSVTFNGVTAPVVSWNDILILVQVPAGATSGPVQVTANGVVSNTIGFSITQPAPTIAALSEIIGLVGDTFTITGSGFGTSGSVFFNGIPGSVSSWSPNTIVTQIPSGTQTGPVTVTSAGQTSNGITLTIMVAPTVTGVSPTSGDVGTVVSIAGNNFATLQSGPVVFFNGAAVAPTSWTNTQVVVTVPMGTRTGPLAVKVGYASSNPTTFTIVPTGSRSLSIFPANENLFISQTVNLSLTDNLEHVITGATWSLSDDTLAQLSTANPPVLTAENPGTETVTATWNGLTATAQFTILASGASMALGTVAWSLPASTSSYTVQNITQAVPSTGTTPDIIAVEDDGQGSIWLRGLSAAGEQFWHTRVGSSPAGSGVDLVIGETPDNFGGEVVLVQNNVNGWPTNSLIDVNGVSGSPTWRYDSPGELGSQNPPAAVAVDQNGYALTVETYQIGIVNSNNTPGYTQSRLIQIDPTTGSVASSWVFPASGSWSASSDGCGENVSITSTPGGGSISVGPDGSYYLAVFWSTQLYWSVPTPGELSCAEYTDQSAQTTFNQLMTISPSGNASMTNLPSNTLGGSAIPDGNGGALVTTITYQQNQASTQVTDFGGSQGTANISNLAASEMVLGDQGTYFTTDGTQVVDVNEASGFQLWTWQPSEGTVQIIAATTGGGIAVLNTLNNGQEDVVRIDSNDNPSYDAWGTTGGSAAYGVLSNATYFAGLWIGVGSDPVIEGMVGQPMEENSTPWPDPDGGAPNNGGSKQAVIYHFLPRNPGPDFPITGNNGTNYEALVENSVPDGPNANLKIPVRHVFVTLADATVDRFVTALRSGAAAVAFIGDSVGFGTGNSVPRYGLQFFNQILASPDIPAGAFYPGYTIVTKSFTDIAPDTQVLFIGACEFDSTMSQWLVPFKSSGQAFIVPSTPSVTFLGAASEAWTAMLVDLAGAQGGNAASVSTAVTFGNQYLTDHPPSPLPGDYVKPVWKYVGDGNVVIKASQ
jgi:Bacterial Ig-like domain (group 2)/IPT/TIG domain/Abnormal spindle-like microcephaly-assoc'd, ASPM-SPD-2-Hydin/Galactose oxidase, central domain